MPQFSIWTPNLGVTFDASGHAEFSLDSTEKRLIVMPVFVCRTTENLLHFVDDSEKIVRRTMAELSRATIVAEAVDNCSMGRGKIRPSVMSSTAQALATTEKT